MHSLYTLNISFSQSRHTHTKKKTNPHVIKCTDYHSLTIKIIHILKYFQTSSVVEVYRLTGLCEDRSVLASSTAAPPQGAAESSRQTGAASVEMYLRKGKNTTQAEM